MKRTFINKLELRMSVSFFVQIEKDKSLCKGLSFIFVPFVLVFLPDKNVQRKFNGGFRFEVYMHHSCARINSRQNNFYTHISIGFCLI